MTDIHVCSLVALPQAFETIRPSHLVSAIGAESMPPTPAGLSPNRHLKLMFNDINEPRDGLIHPAAEHIAELLAFTRTWTADAPMLVHCWAGISRSTAAAYIALCALTEPGREAELADALRQASPTATPNPLMTEIADDMLGRDGRMRSAIEAIGIGEMARAGTPFSLRVKAG